MEDKKYYWIKLRTDFFNEDTIDFLLSQKNGCEYVVLYQMLCLYTANNDGVMATITGEMIIPYNIEKIVRDTKYFDFDTVAMALELFKKLGLVYEEKNKILKIANIEGMIGSESASRAAIKKRKQRLRKKIGDKAGDTLGTNCPTEIDIEKEIEKDIDIEIDNINLYNINKKENKKESEDNSALFSYDWMNEE